MFGREYSTDDDCSEKVMRGTHIFSGVNRPGLTKYPDYPPETQQRMRELYGKLKTTPSSNKTNQKVKRSDQLSLRERWELAKQSLGG